MDSPTRRRVAGWATYRIYPLAHDKVAQCFGTHLHHDGFLIAFVVCEPVRRESAPFLPPRGPASPRRVDPSPCYALMCLLLASAILFALMVLGFMSLLGV